MEVIEAAILTHNDEDVLDRRGGVDLVDRFVRIGRERAGAAKASRRERRHGSADEQPPA